MAEALLSIGMKLDAAVQFILVCPSIASRLGDIFRYVSKIN